jgi:hypothetical protein
MDGTCMLLCEDGYRQAMVGTLGFYDKDGGRIHTTYLAAPPEYGKEKFKTQLREEIIIFMLTLKMLDPADDPGSSSRAGGRQWVN